MFTFQHSTEPRSLTWPEAFLILALSGTTIVAGGAAVGFMPRELSPVSPPTPVVAAEQFLAGTVLEVGTHRPVGGVRLRVSGYQAAAVSAADGSFEMRVRGAPAGSVVNLIVDAPERQHHAEELVALGHRALNLEVPQAR